MDEKLKVVRFMEIDDIEKFVGIENFIGTFYNPRTEQAGAVVGKEDNGLVVFLGEYINKHPDGTFSKR